MLKANSSNLTYAAICLAGLTAFVLVAIYPNLKSMSQVDETIMELNKKIESQSLLDPAYRKLVELVRHKLPDNLPLPEEGKIESGELTRINEALAEMAQSRGVVFEGAVPDAANYIDESSGLIMNLKFRGDFFNFRSLMLDICRLPYLVSIDRMRIETDSYEKRLILKVQLSARQ